MGFTMVSDQGERWSLHIGQGGATPGKHGKPGKLRGFEKLSKSQEKLREI